LDFQHFFSHEDEPKKDLIFAELAVVVVVDDPPIFISQQRKRKQGVKR
jgi:hypothetical protein